MPLDPIDVTIPSDTSRGQEVQDRIIELVEAAEFPMQDVFGIRMALEEAIVNAIKHGNQLDPGKSVHTVARVTGDLLSVTIEDEGRGFNPEDVADPTADENLDKASGRGLMLMKAFMEVEFNERGNRVTLTKRKSAAD